MTDTAVTEARPARGELLTLDVESLAYGGKGVARRNGYVVFVARAPPGDRFTAEVTGAKKGYGEASTREIVRESPDRVPPRCDHGGEPCPGAPWQGLAYEEQLRPKRPPRGGPSDGGGRCPRRAPGGGTRWGPWEPAGASGGSRSSRRSSAGATATSSS